MVNLQIVYFFIIINFTFFLFIIFMRSKNGLLFSIGFEK